MKRRLEIARGFLHTPKILFLDEPTLGLDPQSRNQLWTHVKTLNETEKTTVFLTTHYMDEADRVAHRIAIIDHGAIVAQGTSAELKAAAPTPIRWNTPSSRSPAPPSAMRRPAPPTRCAASRRCGRKDRGETDERDLHLVAARAEALLPLAAQIIASLGQPLLYLLALGFGFGPSSERPAQGNYMQFIAPGVIGMTVLFTLHLLRHRPCSGIASSASSKKRWSLPCRACTS